VHHVYVWTMKMKSTDDFLFQKRFCYGEYHIKQCWLIENMESFEFYCTRALYDKKTFKYR